MSDDSRWMVNFVRTDGRIPVAASSFDDAVYMLGSKTDETDDPYSGLEVIDFITELVHEIEKLQGELIDTSSKLKDADLVCRTLVTRSDHIPNDLEGRWYPPLYFARQYLKDWK